MLAIWMMIMMDFLMKRRPLQGAIRSIIKFAQRLVSISISMVTVMQRL